VTNTRRRSWLIAPLVLAAVIGTGLIPVETKQGVNYSVATYRMPLYAKALDFVQRDRSYARLVRRIVDEGQAAEARALTVFERTRANVRDTPEGFPAVDDHIWHIIVRGYGDDDQKADVFTTLATYAGIPAFWAVSTDLRGLPISFAWIDEGWRVFDVANGIVFRNRRGGLAAFEDLIADRAWLVELVGQRTYRSRPYIDFFASVTLEPPDLLRAEQQMLAPRAWTELKRLVGLRRRAWQR